MGGLQREAWQSWFQRGWLGSPRQTRGKLSSNLGMISGAGGYALEKRSRRALAMTMWPAGWGWTGSGQKASASL